MAAGASYEFQPQASDPEGAPLSFGLQNKPSWLAFDELTGRLFGNPIAGDVGTYAGIVVTASDGTNTSSLPGFAIQVLAAAAPTPTPYSGTAVGVPGTIEAENFDRGGEGVAYHDTTSGNAGGQYRSSENVDIVASADSLGGNYVVNSIQTGEWLAYTINVATGAEYDIELRAASAYATSAYHLEIDGQNLSGRITVPNTGNWSVFQWLGKKRVTLPAGMHVLKVVAEQEYFDLNSIRVTPVTAANPGAGLLFKSGFEGLTALGPLLMFGNGAWQDIIGLDIDSGFTWPPRIWGGTTSRFQLIAGDNVSVTAATLGGYMRNELQNVTGRTGSATRALYSHVQQSVGGASVNFDSTQNDFILFPGASGQGDLYLSYWLKFQPDLLQRMTVNNWAGRVVTDWKTGSGTGGGGDYRLVLSVYGDRANNRLYWNMKGDNVANGGLPPQIFWDLSNSTVPVPVGQWFRVEVFAHRSSGADGRVWVAINGQQLFDRYGANRGVNNLAWNRIMPFINYSSGQSLPAYQWVDDLEVWDRFPATASPH